MGQFLLRNDDVCAATTAEHLQRFTEITDKHGYRVIHAITPRGVCWAPDAWLGSRKNSEICALGAGITIEQNTDLIDFLRSRADKDIIGIHGLWHTHRPRPEEWLQARQILLDLGLYPQYIVPPFNEGSFKSHDFIVSAGEAANLETNTYVASSVAALHSWRFDPEMWQGTYRAPWWDWHALECQLSYPIMANSAMNQRKYAFLRPRIKGPWLDVGCNTGRLLAMVPDGVGVDASAIPIGRAPEELRSRMQQAPGDRLPFPDNTFETVVLCSVLEQCENWPDVLREALRVTRNAGRVIGTIPVPGTNYGTVGRTWWTRAVIPQSTFLHTEPIGNENYFFEVTK